jgi:hypothetical protein
MRRYGLRFVGCLLPGAALAQAPSPTSTTPHAPLSIHASYETYVAGLQVAEVDTGLSFGSRNYRMNLSYHTKGVAGFFFNGHQFDWVDGSWHGRGAAPSVFVERGEWRGVDRLAEINYPQGEPVIRQLLPPNTDEREAVPQSLQDHTIDTLSALAELIHLVAETGRCEAAARTYDGRRAVQVEAQTVGEETLEANSRSSFAGKTLRCDFSGRMLAGFRFGEDRARDGKPMHGSVWFAPVVAGGPPLPVRCAFETRWLGEAIMYLTGAGPASDQQIARPDPVRAAAPGG